MSDQTRDADDHEPDPWQRYTFSEEEAARARETVRRREEDQARRLFGDREPFPVPDVDTDAEPGDTPFPEATALPELTYPAARATPAD